MNNYSKAKLKQWSTLSKGERRKRTAKALEINLHTRKQKQELWETTREMIRQEANDNIIASFVRNIFS
jgi:hypothetical protein